MRRRDGRPRQWKRTLPYGVSYRKRKSPYIVKFHTKTGHHHVGCYQDLTLAAAAAIDYARNVLNVVL